MASFFCSSIFVTIVDLTTPLNVCSITFHCSSWQLVALSAVMSCFLRSNMVAGKTLFPRHHRQAALASEFIIKTTLMPQMSGTEPEWANLLWCRGTKIGMILTPDWFKLLSSYASSNLGTAKVSLTSSNGGERRAAGWAGGQPAGLSGSTDSRRAILAGSASWPSTWT